MPRFPIDFAPPELVAFFCVACYKDLAPTEPFFKSLLGESLAALRSYIPPMVYSKVLTDSSHGISLREWRFDSTQADDRSAKGACTIRKTCLAGGRHERTWTVRLH